jgi:hypothetical protein
MRSFSRFGRAGVGIAGGALLGIACGGGGATGPSLAPTPAPTAAASGPEVGAAGGTVVSPDGRATLIVPAGALSGPVRLTLSAAAGPVDAAAVTGSAYGVGPAEARFTQPSTLTITYDPALRPAGTDEGELRPHQLVGDAWQPAGGSVNAGAHQVVAQVSAAGTFGARWAGSQAGCGAAEAGQFDFWLGDWRFTSAGSLPGTNSITRDVPGCWLREDFRDTSGAVGRSVSLWNPADGAWYQTYVDNRAMRLVLRGVREARGMVLYESPTRRYVWEPVDGNRVRYAGELSADGGSTWRVFFDSTYSR